MRLDQDVGYERRILLGKFVTKEDSFTQGPGFGDAEMHAD
jgi:hypothetical protein